MTAEDVTLLDTLIGEKAVGRLGVRPVLAGKRNALAHAVADLLQEFAKSSSKSRIFESSFVDLALGPMLIGPRVSMPASSGRLPCDTRFPIPRAHRAPRFSDSGAQQGIITDSSDSIFFHRRSV